MADQRSHPGCRGCDYYHSSGIEGYDYWWPECQKPGNERLRNLKSFPFRTERPCFVEPDYSALEAEALRDA